MGAGLHYQYGKRERYLSANDQVRFNAGFSAAHLLRPEASFYGSGEKLAMRFTGYANALFGLGNSNISLAPSVLYSGQGKQKEILAGAAFRYSLKEDSRHTGFEHASAFWLGLQYRMKDAFIPSILYEKGNLAFGISYDINTSDLDAASKSNGGMEVSIRFMSFTNVSKSFKRNVRNL
jgi:type IX secretion system PorP/SprF family membrane protein